MLELRRGRVASIVSQSERKVELRVALEDGSERPAIAYPALTGAIAVGDEVIVNTAAVDLKLGSGGFDIVCVNLAATDAKGIDGAHVMKLNYTPIQHAVHPVEERAAQTAAPRPMATAVLALHGQLAPAAFAFSRRTGAAAGYVQSAGGALAGALSDVVEDLRARDELAGHVTAGAAFGGEQESITVEGALDAAAGVLGWAAALVGPGPGILGSNSRLGHGGLAALSNAHAAMALGLPTVVAPRLSSGDERERHRGLSHHSATVLELALGPVHVPVPNGLQAGTLASLRAAIESGGHVAVAADVEDLLDPYLASGLPASTMGRSLEQDCDFFLAALAAGDVLAQVDRQTAGE